MQSRSGEYIGEAISNDYKISFLIFKGNNLETTGLRRILECVVSNTNIQMLDAGIVSDEGLKLMTEYLRTNTTLQRLRF